MDSVFETERLTFRSWKEGDINPFFEMNQDPKVLEFLPGPLTLNQTRDMVSRIQGHMEDHGFGLFATEEKVTGSFLGFIGFQNTRFDSWFTPATEIGYRLKSSSWGNGYATEGAKACLRWYFEQDFGHRIISFTSIHNTRSERVMQKIGMTSIGTFDHPSLPEGHFLREHVLYEISKPLRDSRTL